jgi:D-alanyl-D-alanine carboxypeptidase/D-alanyl-D-alanine-endopeptidase (penicillin-binding protein 4)
MNALSLPLRRFLALVIFATLVSAANAGAASLEAIQEKVTQYLNSRALRSSEWGIEIVDPKNNQVLFSVNSEKTFTPASVVKVLTTATALEKLGPDFRYKTGVYTDGVLHADGTLAGDLILVGRGDPNLLNPPGDGPSQQAFEELAGKLKAAGVKNVLGNIVGDDSYFEFPTRGKRWTSAEMKSFHGVPISALTVNNNVIWVQVRPTRYQQLVSVGLEPRGSYLRIRNLGVTGRPKSKRTLYARLIPGTRTVVVSGVLPSSYAGYGQYILIDKPAEVAAGMLKDELVRNGISLRGSVDVLHQGDVSPEHKRKWTLLAEYQSAPLVRALEIINKSSQNLHAEMLLRTLGAEFSGSGTEEGTEEAGLQVIREFLAETGVETKGISLTDGSGLSRANLLTPRFQTSLMLFLSTRPHFDLFLNTLAVSGTDGTLRNRLSSERGVIHAKTGTLSGVSSLSGYMTTKSGRNLVFSIFANFRASVGRIRKTIDEICRLFVSQY